MNFNLIKFRNFRFSLNVAISLNSSLELILEQNFISWEKKNFENFFNLTRLKFLQFGFSLGHLKAHFNLLAEFNLSNGHLSAQD